MMIVTNNSVMITTITAKESDDKSQIRSMGTDKFAPTLVISGLLPPTYFHYHNHPHHHYDHFYYCHYNINKYLSHRIVYA